MKRLGYTAQDLCYEALEGNLRPQAGPLGTVRFLGRRGQIAGELRIVTDKPITPEREGEVQCQSLAESGRPAGARQRRYKRSPAI